MRFDVGYGMYDAINFDGGPGSGNHGHSGRKGMRGGSAPSGKRDYGSFEVAAAKDGTLKPTVTLSKDVDSNGGLTPKRQELHKRIIDMLIDGTPKAKGQAVMTFLGGGPASGKSSITRDPDSGVMKSNEAVCIDSDSIKQMIPEYQKMLANGDDTAADCVHKESSMIAWKALSIAQNEGYHCVMDGTGDGTAESMRESINEAKAKGMYVKGVYASCATEEAVRRAYARATNSDNPEDKGRKVPEKLIRKTHKNVSKCVPDIADDYDELTIYDTNTKTAKKIAHKDYGKSLVIDDKKLYSDFLEKANEIVEE